MAAGRAKDWKMQASTRFCAAIPAGFNRVHMQNVSPGFAVKFVLRMKTIAEWNWSCLWESVTDKAGNTKCNCPRGSLLFCSEGKKKKKRNFFFFLFFLRGQKSNLCAKPTEIILTWEERDGEEVENWNLQCWQDGKSIPTRLQRASCSMCLLQTWASPTVAASSPASQFGENFSTDWHSPDDNAEHPCASSLPKWR